MRRRFVTLDVFTESASPAIRSRSCSSRRGSTRRRCRRSRASSICPRPCSCFRPPTRQNRAKLRIFTPARELPFAGHPTVGTAVLLGRLDGGAGERNFMLEENIGPVPCRVTVLAARTAGAPSFDIPRLPAKEADSPDVAAIAAALGLRSPNGARRVYGGALVGGQSVHLRAGARARCDRAASSSISRDSTQAFGGGDHAAAFIFCRETAEAGNSFHARMFAPVMGVHEDPATGSAVAAFAGYLAAHGGYADGEHVVGIEQGYEMGRASLIELTLKISGGKLTGASIGGSAVVVMEGTIEA